MSLEESQAGELASYVQENLEAVQLAGKLAQQKTQGTLEMVRGLVGQVSAGISPINTDTGIRMEPP